VFKHHHESSTVELFYDLFFVANLTTFTVNYEIVDADSLKNYIGFFTILWFTWLETSFFDVRFATDSVFNRVCKAISFGVMTGFAICGAIYDTQNVGENVKAFRALSIILMVSRLALVVQNGIVLFYVRNYQKVFVPLLSTMATLFISAMIFLGTFWGYGLDNTGESFPNQEDSTHTYIAYYVIVCVEAAAVITISCVWRVVSFKRTHLVERIGLLTLIIMGEGIIGMTKSVSKILQNSSTTSSSDIGTIISSVLLIYFIWVLYFDQIEYDRFGTIRQQIWVVLHFPLHLCILLTVEGSTALILWNIIVHTDTEWWSYFPVSWPADSVFPLNDFKNYFDSPEEVVEWLEQGVGNISLRFKPNALEEEYDFKQNFTAILNINSTFGSEAWDEKAGEIVYGMWVSVENFIFGNFGVEVPENEERGHGDSSNQEFNKNNALWTVFVYFYIAAGMFLVILGILYWFGRTRKSKGE
jgi:low temperature requirement protein LtrA